MVSSGVPFPVSDLGGANRGVSALPTDVGATLSETAVSGRGFGVLVRFRLEIGSKDMTRGLGSAIGATSITSRRVTLTSQVVVGDIVVGRVNVEVNI